MKLYHYVIKQDLCRICESCVKACPEDAIIVDEEKRVSIDQSRCTRCGDCQEACKLRAIVKKRGLFLT